MAAPVAELVSLIDSQLNRQELSIFDTEAYGAATTEHLLHFSIFGGIPAESKQALLANAAVDEGVARAVGAPLGTAAGDSVGAPLEFQDVVDYGDETRAPDWPCPCESCPAREFEGGRAFWVPGSDASCPYCQTAKPNDEESKPARGHGFEVGTGVYSGRVTNQFRLKPGQWTDDASMALCLADSLLVRRGLDGSDLRQRFYAWCFGAYNTPFGNDPLRTFQEGMDPDPQDMDKLFYFNKGSIGCGTNMSRNLEKMATVCVGLRPPPVFESHTEDSGNGPLIRLAALPVFFHARPMEELLSAARASSRATHPGPIAAECCAFMAFVLQRALVREGTENIRSFLESAVHAYSELLRAAAPDGLPEKEAKARADLVRLLESPQEDPSPDSPNWQSPELAWRWRVERTRWCQTLVNRGERYNGYPVSSGYVGSFCFDGLAMSLWAAYHTTSFDQALERCVNLCGDADSTASICGALCGAFYGVSAVHPRIVASVQRWDNGGDIALRGVLLWHLGKAFDGTAPSLLPPLVAVSEPAAAECTKSVGEVVAWIRSLPETHVPDTSKESLIAVVESESLGGQAFTEYIQKLSPEVCAPKAAAKLRAAWKNVLAEARLTAPAGSGTSR